MVDSFQLESASTAPRPVRKKFAKPPVKVACLPWCVAPPEALQMIANPSPVAPREPDVAGKSRAPT